MKIGAIVLENMRFEDVEVTPDEMLALQLLIEKIGAAGKAARTPVFKESVVVL